MLSVVIPAFNETDAIADTVETVNKTLKEAGIKHFEVIVVDDGSSDNTAQHAEQAGATVVRNLQNLGYGRSLKNGINKAQYDTIVITDADGTYPIDRIPDLLEQYNMGYDMVVGQRTGEHYRESFVKAPLRLILKALVEFTAGRKILDINSGLRVFSKESAVPIFPHLSNSFSFTTTITLIYMLTYKYVLYIPIDYHARIGSTKVRLIRDSLRTLQFIVQTALVYNPLKIYLVLCLITLSVGVVCIAVGLIGQIVSAMLLGLGCFLITIVLFALGLIADLLRQLLNKNDS